MDVKAVVIVETVQAKTLDRVGRPHIEQLRIGTGLLIGPVHCARSVALRVAGRESGQARNQCAPSNAEALSVAVSGEIGLTRESEGAGAVVVVAIADRSRKVAAGEQIGGGRNSTGASQRLVVGVGLATDCNRGLR